MATSLFGLENKRVMVLGGGLGMGEATVRLLNQLGCHVAIADLELERAERVAAEVSAAGGTSVPIAVDVTDDAALVAAVAKAERELGPLDGLVTVVGMAGWSPIVDMTMDTWDTDHRRNLRYFFLAAREVAASMLRREAAGSIVCIASIDGIRSAPYHASYGAAKAGLISLVKTMSVEWSAQNIRVNAVAPGSMVTPRIPDRGPELERQMMATVPMKRRGGVVDIAKAVAFFLSDLSPYVTGQTLAVDGGYTAMGPLSYGPQVASQGGVIGGTPG